VLIFAAEGYQEPELLWENNKPALIYTAHQLID
jgi:hypothetical protein